MEYPSFNISERTKMYHEKALKYFKECVVSFHKDFCENDTTKKDFLVINETKQFSEQLIKVCNSEASKIKVENGLLKAWVDINANRRIYLFLSIKYTD